MAFPVACTTQQTIDTNDAAVSSSCPCFSKSTLDLFTTENTTDSSCQGYPDNLFLWRVQEELKDYWHPMGYGVIRLERPSCLLEGDIMQMIEPEEASVCFELMQNRCQELGLLKIPQA
eukprot:521780_1